MKSYLLLLTALVLLFTTSCTKQSLPSINLSTDTEEVNVTSYNNSVAFTLSWEETGGNTEISQIYVQFCPDKEFVSPYVLRSSGDSFIVTFKDLKKIQDNFGILENYTLIIRLLVEGEEVSSVYSNKVRVNVNIE